MAKNFKTLLARMSPAARARAEKGTHEIIQEMALDDLRAVLSLTQEDLAKRLRVGQAAVSKIERRPDTYMSTLRKFIEAMGGELEICAILPRGV